VIAFVRPGSEGVVLEKMPAFTIRDHRHAVWSKPEKARFNGPILDQREATAETSIVSPLLFRKA